MSAETSNLPKLPDQKLGRYRLREDESYTAFGKQASIWPKVKRLFSSYLRPQLPFYLIAIVLLLIYAASVWALPWLLENVIDEFLAAKDLAAIQRVALVGGLIVAVRAASGFLQAAALSYATLRATRAMRNDAYTALLAQDYAFFLVNPPGQIIARAWNAISALGQLGQRLVISLGRDLLTALGLLGYMIYSNWTWAMLILVMAPILAVPILIAGRVLRSLARRLAGVEGSVLDAMTEVVAHIRAVKTDQGESFERERLGGKIDELYQIGVRNVWFAGGVEPVLDMVAAIGVTAILLFGGQQVVSGQATAGELVAYLGSLMLMIEPARRVLNLNTAIQQAAPSIERMYEILDSKPQITEAAKPIAFKPSGPVAVAFDNVSFSYDGENAALSALSFEARPGEMTAIVGPSGSGKSTIVALLTRLFDVDQGAVRLNGQDLRGMSLQDLRSAVSVVSQNAALFAGSVKDNIRYGRQDLSEAELVTAANIAQVSDFVASLPEGFAAEVGPRGDRLSGGQKQRVAIARALAKDAPVVLLDEATSALDNETEAAFVQQVDELRSSGERTLIVIAHRLSTIRNADRVLVLSEGKLVEAGSYAVLAAGTGPFSKMLQLG